MVRLLFDDAVCEESVIIFVVPDFEAGHIPAKQLEYLAEAEIAGIVSARVPIVLTSRADKPFARLRT